MDSEHIISESAAAEFLLNRKKSRYLDPFLAQDCTLREAADRLGLSSSRMSYWVKKLLALGLIVVVRTSKQQRHQVRVYRSVANSLAFPIELVSATDVEILEQFLNPNWQTFLGALAFTGRKNASGWHIRLLRQDDLPVFQLVPASGELEEARILNVWVHLRLDAQKAADFRADLNVLLERYLSPSEDQAKPYLLHLGLVERPSY